jgi:hypothetical protein
MNRIIPYDTSLIIFRAHTEILISSLLNKSYRTVSYAPSSPLLSVTVMIISSATRFTHVNYPSINLVEDLIRRY